MKKPKRKRPTWLPILQVLAGMAGLFASIALVLVFEIRTTAWVLFSLILGTPLLGFACAMLAGLAGAIITSEVRNPEFSESESVSYNPSTGFEMNGAMDSAGNNVGSDGTDDLA